MKKNLLAGLLLLWACSVYGQKRIVDPVRSDFSYVAKFDRVEITGRSDAALPPELLDPVRFADDVSARLRQRPAVPVVGRGRLRTQ